MYLPCCPVPNCLGKQGELSGNCLPNLAVRFILSPSILLRLSAPLSWTILRRRLLPRVHGRGPRWSEGRALAIPDADRLVRLLHNQSETTCTDSMSSQFLSSQMNITEIPFLVKLGTG